MSFMSHIKIEQMAGRLWQPGHPTTALIGPDAHAVARILEARGESVLFQNDGGHPKELKEYIDRIIYLSRKGKNTIVPTNNLELLILMVRNLPEMVCYRCDQDSDSMITTYTHNILRFWLENGLDPRWSLPGKGIFYWRMNEPGGDD